MRIKSKLIWLLGLLGILIAGGVAGLLLYPRLVPSTSSQPSPTAASLGILPDQAYSLVQQGAYVLDVRTQDQWNQYHIQGSTLIPLADLQSRLTELPKDRSIVVVCTSGPLSQQGASLLHGAGFPQVNFVTGGLQAWIKAGLPVQSATP